LLRKIEALLVGSDLTGDQDHSHGVNLLSDPETMQAMRADKNLVEVNLISNKVLGYVRSFDEHPFPRFLRFGIPSA